MAEELFTMDVLGYTTSYNSTIIHLKKANSLMPLLK